MIKAVIFDVDGVLIDSLKSNTKFFSDLFVFFGREPITEEYYKPFFYLPGKEFIRHYMKPESEEELERIFLVLKSRYVPYPIHLVKVHPELEKILKSLSEKYLLGVATSRSVEVVFEVAAFAALQNYFKSVVAYQHTTKHKPNPEPLLLCAKNLNVLPEECVYIGDQPTDLQAARAAGMKVIFCTKENLEGADSITDDLAKLEDLIGKL